MITPQAWAMLSLAGSSDLHMTRCNQACHPKRLALLRTIRLAGQLLCFYGYAHIDMHCLLLCFYGHAHIDMHCLLFSWNKSLHECSRLIGLPTALQYPSMRHSLCLTNQALRHPSMRHSLCLMIQALQYPSMRHSSCLTIQALRHPSMCHS